jgi:hypothetical protein
MSKYEKFAELLPARGKPPVAIEPAQRLPATDVQGSRVEVI